MGDYNDMSDKTKRALYPAGTPDHVNDKPDIEPTMGEVFDAMTTFGGSFIESLAETMRRADRENFAALVAAFPGYWTHYRNVAKDLKNGKI